MQQTTPCSRCGQAGPVGGAFCPNYGAPMQATPQSAPTQLASAPPDAYPSGPSQPVYAPPLPPPSYVPGLPPVMTPGGPASWTQPQKKSGRRFAFGCVVGVVLLVLLLGGGGFLAVRLLSSGKNGTATIGQHGSTPGGTAPTSSTAPRKRWTTSIARRTMPE